MGADYNYFEGFIIRNTDVAFWAGQKRIIGSNGLTVKNCIIEDVDKGIHCEWSGSKDFCIADNVFIGRHDQTEIHSWFKPPFPTQYKYEKCLFEYAVKLAGEGLEQLASFYVALSAQKLADLSAKTPSHPLPCAQSNVQCARFWVHPP